MDTESAPPERRKADRRRRSRVARPDESWFGTFIRESGPAPLDDDNGRSVASASSAPISAPAQPGARVIQASARIHRAFLSARAALGVALIFTLLAASFFGVSPSWGVIAVSAGYALLTLSMWLMPSSHPLARNDVAGLTRLQWLCCIGVDIGSFVALHVLSRASNLNYVALLVLPVLMAGVLMPRRQALATAAGVVLLLLANAWLAWLAGGEPASLLSQVGLAGSGLFVISLLASELAARIAREELTAKDSLEMARQQAQLNRLVIEEMQDGVLVVDRAGRVRTANPAARGLLVRRGLGPAAPFQLRGVEAWAQLVKTVERGFHEAVWPEAGRDVQLQFEGGPTRTVRVRIRFTRGDDAPSAEELCVLLLEDVRSLQTRMRTEKLAAMGRVSAGIAHEIRNPLSAIGQANALLSEDATTPQQQQLTRMVADNVKRLKRIVDDVMQVAPGAALSGELLDLPGEVRAICSEWARANSIEPGEGGLLRLEIGDGPLPAVFESEHLRRVLVNLLDNAKRHCTDLPAAILVRLIALDDTTAQLSVASDGAVIPEDVERYLFEPFFSTRSRGSGLGLYICRQLCDQYGATIEYRLRPPSESNRNNFFVNMRRRAVEPVSEALPPAGPA